MYQLLDSWFVRLEHVSAVGLAHVVPNRPGQLQMEVQLVGGQTITLIGPEQAVSEGRTALIQAVTATG